MNLPFELPLYNVTIHANGYSQSNWVVIDPEIKPKTDDAVLIKDISKFHLCTFVEPYSFRMGNKTIDLILYDVMGTVIEKSNSKILGDEYYEQIASRSL